VDIQFNKQLIVNQSVFHEKFGTGTILQLEGNWPETKALIEFKSGDKRSLLLRFARLGPVS
jgi:DNA helicase-2/ATP-dependent DNA helicase PcrA